MTIIPMIGGIFYALLADIGSFQQLPNRNDQGYAGRVLMGRPYFMDKCFAPVCLHVQVMLLPIDIKKLPKQTNK